MTESMTMGNAEQVNFSSTTDSCSVMEIKNYFFNILQVMYSE